ncbi:RNA-directed DNA polymerase, eukaryota, reverse transcriptase zinc-binding domain protein [Tanacetum coccineum]
MRPKRTIKPTQIFDNSSSIASRNKNKQKISAKNNKNSVVTENILGDDGVNGEKEICMDKDVRNGSIRSDEEDSTEENQSKVQKECMNEDQNKLNVRNKNNVDVEVMSGEQEEVASGEANNSGIGHVPCTSDNCNTDNDTNAQFKEFAKESNVVNSSENDKHATYAQTVTKSLIDDGNKLFTIPTSVNSKGEEVVLFDEELVREGYEKWKLTVCGYFVGCKMHINVLKYNIRRMWTRYGLKDIVVDADEMCFFKFKNEDGMKYIIDQSPWIVNGKPLIVQKWDPEVVIEKETPCKIPVWIRLYNVPLEA